MNRASTATGRAAPSPHPAAGILGAWFAALALLLSASCDNNRGTPDWNTPGTAPPPPAAATAPSQPAKDAPRQQEPAAPATAAATDPPAAASEVQPAAEAPTTAGLRFITYNVENWLTMDRYVDRKALKGASKPASEKRAVVQILSRHQPDVVGVCEIGTRDDLTELQTALKASGLDLPHASYTGGSDAVRHLGLLSRFPITVGTAPATLDYQLNGSSYAMNRGILDATVTAHGKAYHFLGVHLKSARGRRRRSGKNAPPRSPPAP